MHLSTGIAVGGARTLLPWDKITKLTTDPRAMPAVLDFPRDTRVGGMPWLALYGVWEEELGRAVELWAEDESSESEERKAPPRAVSFSLFLSFLCRSVFTPGDDG